MTKRVLGVKHPYTLISMNNLARMWKETGRETEAVNLIEECAQLQKRILGLDNPYILPSSTALAKRRAE
ncbi:hypothetical protein P152DRAFT_454334 [Eremomyces bilateralis CBS 781.70]|uniref:Kinesin light chain n=1 Tax=Eremomyces bilateralis CBS 781.70 TaxID=1392243 RepID=A0A6G1GDV1_9PEZI|nr:uncharacterized protein P152DRAFT_454334 [Eremomyces bilateralis CBS 781.70]KAF1816086.1 hypothetical protein P152DRAFT_454334 [Eremomyces bilateralis CBS 781.70]